MSGLNRQARMMEGGPSFSLGNRLTRAVWMLCWALLASWTPAPLHGWRRLLLRAFGATIGRGARIYGSTRVWLPANLIMADGAWLGPHVKCYNQDRITIGARTVISQGAHLCTGSHDINDFHFQLVTRPIVIGANAWIAAEAFVGPGVRVGDGAVLGARGVAMRDIEAWTVYAGNPAHRIKRRQFDEGLAPEVA